MRIRVETDVDNTVHFHGPYDMTVCGLETMGDETIGIQPGESSTDDVTCRSCLTIMRHCKSIRIRKSERNAL